MLDKGQLELIKGLVDKNLGEPIEQFETPSSVIKDPVALVCVCVSLCGSVLLHMCVALCMLTHICTYVHTHMRTTYASA